MRLRILMAALFMAGQRIIAGFTTPNTGINWNLDSVVANSSGTLTGTFPNYTMNDTITISQNDLLAIPPGAIITTTQGSGKGFTVLGILQAIGTHRLGLIR